MPEQLTVEQFEEEIRPLINAAKTTLSQIRPNENHSIVSAARTKINSIITAFNVVHFTGSSCAEPIVLGAAAAKGCLPKDLTHIVAVGARTGDVTNPCGKCRQMMLDMCPQVKVVVIDGEGQIKVVGVRELLPFAYEFVPTEY
jgi:cytidine deaminase